ncbi:YceI family protein [Flavobacterium sp. SUN046]|uniref:YceI family protein n=1 Tax=Flavobacterium sp. SUN046 TaxID=3002440 RepID=UPI002DB6B152|nr:YceI family protein [Flavobacterium sp. SUN046]MEC4050500.1 YceI family protein [Flavobacterium sp. SUN046]
MRNLKTLAIALLVTLSTVATAQTKKVDAAKSKITWIGKKVTGQHEGTVNLKDGSLVFKGKKLTGGTFTVDMTSLTATDLSGEYQGKLNGHLKSEDFFGTEKFPTSKLTFKKIADKGNGVYTVTADLTIKGITNPVTFDMAVKANTATSSVKINRTKYDIKYGSGSFFDNLGDKAISDDFELNVTLQF